MLANFDVTPSFLFMVLLACNKLQPSKTQVNCSNFPCYWGGTCMPGPPDMCSCPPGRVQPFCTCSCLIEPCVNGTCVGDVCNCDTNFAGPTCESAIAAYLSPGEITVTEGDVGQQAVTVQVCRQPSSEEVTLQVGTVAGSALPDDDFVNIPSNLRQDVTINAGQTCTPVNVFIISDLTQETMSENFRLFLYDPQPSSSSMVHFVSHHYATVITIIDDDPGCLMEPCQNGGTCNDDDLCSCQPGFVGPSCQSTIAVYLNPLVRSVTEGNDGDDISVQIHVCRLQTTLTSTVAVTTSQDSARISSDFAHINTTVTIPIGQVCAPVDISIVSDMIFEPTEEFHLVILPIPSVYIRFGEGTATVTIIDNDDTDAPVITNCPGDRSVSIPAGTSSVSVSWVPPTASDNSGDVTLLSSHQPGDTFSLGPTTVTYTATDGAGNTVFCQFVVTVMTDIDECSIGSHICDDMTSECVNTIGSYRCDCRTGYIDESLFPGLQQPTCEADVTPPVISGCPSDIFPNVQIGTTGTTVSWTEPTATDNSGTATLISQSHLPGSFFLVGRTTVTYRFADPAGNEADCTFDVIVQEATELEIQLMDIINTITRENTTTKEVVMASEMIAEISDYEDFLEEDPQRIELLISSLESVVRAGEATINVTDPVVRSINNLMNLDQGILEDGMIEGGRAVAALEGQITNFQTNDGNFSTVLDNVGVTAVKIDARSVASSLAYANLLPENETLLIGGAFQEGNTRLFSDGDAIPLNRTATSISVPSSVLDLLGGAGVELTAVPVTFIIYGNDVLFRPSMPTEVEENIEEEDNSTVTERVASQIISAIIRTENTSIVNLPPGSPVITTFLSNLTISVEETIEAHDCVVWSYDENTGQGFWTKDGCERMFHENRDLTMCSCGRLGSFAILIRVRKGPVEAQVTLYYITLIGSIISGLALVGCLIIFVSLKSFRSKQPTHIHINLCLSLLGFYIAFLLSPLAVGKEIYCTVASVSIHFFCLATLAWMSTEAMNMYYLFLNAERSTVRHFIPIACLLAYGLPAACALLVVFLDNSTDFQSASYCFIHPGYALYFGFLTEVGAMFVFNFIIFIWVIRKIICRPLMVSKTAENAKRNEVIKRVRHAILFWFVLGLSWIFGFFAAVDTKTLIFDYLYCFFISIQGILMFLLLCVANPAFKGIFCRTDSTQTKVTRQTQLGSSSQSNIPMDSMDNPSTSATE